MQERIMIEGKWYDENLNEIAVKSYEVLAFGITFTEGNEYTNFFGTYRVLSILSDKEMQVEYFLVKSGVIAGQKYVYPMAAQAQTIFNEKRRVDADMKKLGAKKFEGNKDLFTIDYIKKHGNISVCVPTRYHRSFSEQYKRITGDDLDRHLGHGYTVVTNENWWGVTLRVYIPHDNSVLNNLSLPEEGIHIDDNSVVIYNNEFVRGLFYAGLRLGKNEQIAA